MKITEIKEDRIMQSLYVSESTKLLFNVELSGYLRCSEEVSLVAVLIYYIIFFLEDDSKYYYNASNESSIHILLRVFYMPFGQM